MESVAPAGDVDGDGFVDVLFAGDADNGGLDGKGVVYLLRGPAPTGELALLDVAEAFDGPFTDAYMAEITGPIDVDGDGLSDVIMGARDGANREGGDGDVFVLRGPVAESSVTEADTNLHGTALEHLGARLQVLGDVNGDGLGDLGVSRTQYGDETSVYVVLDMLPGTYHPSDVGVVVYTHAYANPVPCEVGDVDGDGLADVGVAAVDGGSTIPIVLSPLGGSATLDLPDAAAITLTSWNSGYEFNALDKTTPLGDWNGDGFGDFAAVNESYGPPDQAWCVAAIDCPGAVFVVAGPLSRGTFDLETQADWIASDWGVNNLAPRSPEDPTWTETAHPTWHWASPTKAGPT